MQVFFILTSLNRIDLQALTLVGPSGTSPVLDSLAVLCLDNPLFICLQILCLCLDLYDQVVWHKLLETVL